MKKVITLTKEMLTKNGLAADEKAIRSHYRKHHRPGGHQYYEALNIVDCLKLNGQTTKR